MRDTPRNVRTSTLACTQTKLRSFCGNPGCGRAPGRGQRQGVPTVLLRSRRLFYLHWRKWACMLQNKAAPSQPRPRNLNCRRHLLCSFSHLSTHPHQNPLQTYQSATHQIPGRHPGLAPTSPSGAGALCPSGTHLAGQDKCNINWFLHHCLLDRVEAKLSLLP